MVQRNDPDMVQSVLAEQSVIPEVRAIEFLDETGRVLASARREYLGRLFEAEQMGVAALDPARLRDAMEVARRTQQGFPFLPATAMDWSSASLLPCP